MTDEPGAEGSDAAVYPELTRANLLRMRGEYDQARSLCLAILRRYPNNATAHTLLGDICSEEDDLQHAAEWYEMALDLEPENQADHKKLESVRQRIADHEAATTAQQLGIPTSKSKAKVFAAVIVCLVLLIGVGAFFLGDYFRSKRVGGGTVTTPIELGSEDSGTQAPVKSVPDSGPTPDSVDPNKTVTNVPPVQEPIGAVTDDEKDLERVKARVAHGENILEAQFDPRSNPPTVILSVKINPGDDPKSTAADVGSSAIDVLGVTKVTVRTVRDGQVVFIADLEQSDLGTIELDAAGKRPHDALVGLLKNRWERPSAPAPSTR